MQFTKEQLIEHAKYGIERYTKAAAGFPRHMDVAMDLELARIALASLEAEPVYQFWNVQTHEWVECDKATHDSFTHIQRRVLYTAPPAPASVPDLKPVGFLFVSDDGAVAYSPADWPMKGFNLIGQIYGDLNACRAAMLQCADTELQRKAAIHDALCEKYNVESLDDFVDWQRNHIAELEAAPPAPVGPGETAVMPDYPGYALTQRECFQAGKEAGLAEAGNSPVIPDGWKMVPVVLTGAMTNAMTDAILDDLHNVDVWRSVLAAAPQQEVK